MITESLLNSYYFLVFNKNSNIKRNKHLYESMLDILNFYKKTQGVEIPLESQDKFNCLVKICKMKMQGKSDENVIDSLSVSGKYKDLLSFIQNKSVEESDQDKTIDNLNQLALKPPLRCSLTMPFSAREGSRLAGESSPNQVMRMESPGFWAL